MVKSMDTIVNLCKARGYIYPGSEIYGGLSNTWDYGPLGVNGKSGFLRYKHQIRHHYGFCDNE